MAKKKDSLLKNGSDLLANERQMLQVLLGKIKLKDYSREELEKALTVACGQYTYMKAIYVEQFGEIAETYKSKSKAGKPLLTKHTPLTTRLHEAILTKGWIDCDLETWESFFYEDGIPFFDIINWKTDKSKLQCLLQDLAIQWDGKDGKPQLKQHYMKRAELFFAQRSMRNNADIGDKTWTEIKEIVNSLH